MHNSYRYIMNSLAQKPLIEWVKASVLVSTFCISALSIYSYVPGLPEFYKVGPHNWYMFALSIVINGVSIASMTNKRVTKVDIYAYISACIYFTSILIFLLSNISNEPTCDQIKYIIGNLLCGYASMLILYKSYFINKHGKIEEESKRCRDAGAKIDSELRDLKNKRRALTMQLLQR